MNIYWLEIFGLAVALGCDAFAVGLGVGTKCHRPRQVFRLSFHFGFFQFAMPLAGWALGQAVVEFTRHWAPWLTFAVLVFLGGKMIWESFRGEDESSTCADPTTGMSLIALSVATSIDALGVGFSLGIIDGDILWAAIVIGVVAGIMTFCAMKLGRRLSARFGSRIGVAGGIILIIIAFKLLLS
jgi:manganese efflux pump family protein